jgi:3-oxoacyl-[acyl-carrier protein] reductase
MRGLAGTAVLVTGGSRGIGLSIAQAFVAGGARVAITGRTQSHLDAAAKALGEGAYALRADVRQPDEASQAIDAAASRFGGLDVLVNNAAVGLMRPVAELSFADWQQTIETNLSGVFYCCHAALPHLKRRGAGWIINISSLAGANPFAGGAAYCASKAGLNAFSEALMQEVRYDNIRVSYIMPGSVATGFSNRAASDGADWKIAPEDIADVVIHLVTFPSRTLPSRVEIRPSRPPQTKKSS